MIGFILYIVSSLLKIIIGPICYLYGTIISNEQLAIAKDQYGNGVAKYLFNSLLIKKEGYKFGNIDETISSVLGKNKRDNTLKFLGKILDYILDKLDKNHSIKSIDETENNN